MLYATQKRDYYITQKSTPINWLEAASPNNHSAPFITERDQKYVYIYKNILESY